VRARESDGPREMIERVREKAKSGSYLCLVFSYAFSWSTEVTPVVELLLLCMRSVRDS